MAQEGVNIFYEAPNYDTRRQGVVVLYVRFDLNLISQNEFGK